MTDPAKADSSTPSTVGVYLDTSTIDTASTRLMSLAGRVGLIHSRLSAVSQPLPAGADEVSVAGAEALGARTSRVLEALSEFHGKVVEDSARLQQINSDYNKTDESNARRFDRAVRG